MKRILAVILSLIMMFSLFALVSCDKTADDDDTDTTVSDPDVTSTTVTTAAESVNTTEVDVTTTDAVITTVPVETTANITTVPDEQTSEVLTTEAPAVTTEEYLYADEEFFEIYSASGDHSPQNISTKGKGIGAAITMPENHWISTITVNCPSWSDDYGSLTFCLYKWDTDFKTTTAAEPLYTELFQDYPDNAVLDVVFDEQQFGEGKYLFLMKDGVDPVFTDEAGDTFGGTGVGVWMGKVLTEDDNDWLKQYEIESYVNGRISTSSGTVNSFSQIHNSEE